MPEDANKIGFAFFLNENENPIANEAAVRHALSHLFNKVAFEASFDHLDNAVQAVQEAARHKAGGQADPLPDPQDFTDGQDFSF